MRSHPFSRRNFVRGAAAFTLLPSRLLPNRSPGYGREFPDMLVAHLSGKLNTLAEKWDRERDAIRTPAQVEARNRFVREKFREMVHGFPERTLLNPELVASHERDGYRVENVMFQSRPDFWVTGNLYIPASGRGPFPGIISPCGHYPDARMEPEYQAAYVTLVRSGFVVLAYDPIGQGERRQYWNSQTNRTEVAPDSTYEHSMPGQLLLLMGEDLTHYRIWDGMRAIDYLLTRQEVDPQKIGCTGHSGGGTLTLFISLLDERIRCAAINEGGVGHRWPIHLSPESRIGPSDVEQNIFPGAVCGIDQCDMAAGIAPRPLLVTIEDDSDWFRHAVDHVRRRYEQLGAAGKFATAEANDPHSWTPKLRLATADWFSRWFYGRPGPAAEKKFQAEPRETLYCTPNGSVRYSHQGQTIFSLILRKQAQLPPVRKPPAGTAEFESFRAEMTGRIRKLLHYDNSEQPLGVRQVVTTPRNGYKVEKFEFLSEPGIYIPTWVFVPERQDSSAPVTLYVHEAGKEADGQEFGLLERLARKGRLIVAVDVRGVGETEPPHAPPSDKTGEFGHLFDVETALTYMTWFMDESLFGMRVQDVVRGVDYVLSRVDAAGRPLRAVGRGAGALWTLYAAALDPRINSVIAERGLLSYRSLTGVDRYLHGAGIFVRDVLLSFDLPQVAAAVAARDLILISPVDAMKDPVDASTAARTYDWTARTYRSAGADGRFRILGGNLNPELL